MNGLKLIEKKLKLGTRYNQKELSSVFETNFGYTIKGINPRNYDGEAIVILTSSPSGPYKDVFTGNSFEYIREGLPEKGDQKLTPANKALINAIEDHRKIYCFRKDEKQEIWTYLGNVIVKDFDYIFIKDEERSVYSFSMEIVNDYTSIDVSINSFDYVFKQFSEYIQKDSLVPFTSFSHPILYSNEYYKQEIREKALEILRIDLWRKDSIGDGSIIKRLIDAIEIKGNNLLQWQAKYGEESRIHRKLIEANESKDDIEEIERVFFDIFHHKEYDGNSFEKMKSIFGSKYPLLAYIFYLKDDRRYVPIAPTYFDNAFTKLGVSFETSQNASWSNYKEYLQLTKYYKELLETKLSSEVKLIDAHTFLFIIGRIELDDSSLGLNIESKWIDPVAPQKSGKTKKESFKNSNIDWESIDKQKRLKGRKAEEIVIDYEKDRLNKIGREDLALKVLDCSKKLGLGYDVLSFSEKGDEMHIEVKSTNGNSFIITSNEVEVSKVDPCYHIYVVKSKIKRGEYEIHIIETPDLENELKFHLSPKGFYCEV